MNTEKTEQELIKQLIFSGFYKHYKYNPNEELGKGLYQVIGITSVKDLGKNFIDYRPLYKSSFVYQQGRWNDGREISEWFKPLENGKARYEFIIPGTDLHKLCEQLVQELYGDSFFAIHG